MQQLLFKKVEYPLHKLLEDIALGEIGLPDIQRPFVWETTRVRDLFDSMYRGYPIGMLLFWENGYAGEHRSIGTDAKQKAPRLLVVDGQQRLTALYAVMKGVPIVDADFRQRRLRIAFNPLESRFEVSNSAIARDPTWIPDITVLWNPELHLHQFITDFLARLPEHKVPANQGKHIVDAIQKLVNIIWYPLTALEISYGASEQEVAEIFVRINSGGRTLYQADFILTLMSVSWDEGRKELEEFSRQARQPASHRESSPYNPYFQPSPDQLLRVEVSLAFRRASLKDVYSILRGRDLETKQISLEQREKQFGLLKKAHATVLDLRHWHEFLKVIVRAGYVHPLMITSQSALVYTYAIWLMGKERFGFDFHRLRNIMARWLFMSLLTGRYSGSAETRMEVDLALLDRAESADDFVRVLEQEMAAALTSDFWEVTFPTQLVTASARSPAQFAYFAALCILDAPALYSTMKVRELLSPTGYGKRETLERHHLFPRKYLMSQGITSLRETNQVRTMRCSKRATISTFVLRHPGTMRLVTKAAFLRTSWNSCIGTTPCFRNGMKWTIRSSSRSDANEWPRLLARDLPSLPIGRAKPGLSMTVCAERLWFGCLRAVARKSEEH